MVEPGNPQRFEEARLRVQGGDRLRAGIGTLGEKSLHAILKNYFEPTGENQETQMCIRDRPQPDHRLQDPGGRLRRLQKAAGVRRRHRLCRRGRGPLHLPPAGGRTDVQPFLGAGGGPVGGHEKGPAPGGTAAEKPLSLIHIFCMPSPTVRCVRS